MKGRFYKNGGKKEGFSVFPIKDSFFLSRNHGAEKDSWSMNRKSAPHLRNSTAHCHSAPAAFCPPLSHSINVPLTYHSGGTVLIPQWRSQEKYFQVVRRNQTITPIHFSGWRRLLAHHIYCLTVLELNKKVETRKSLLKFTNTNLQQKIEA